MDVSFILKVFGAGLVVSLAYQILSKSGRDELAILVSVSGVIIIFTIIITKLSSLISAIRAAFGI
ncbi:MAG: stage III sporulation protein AC [Ruminococcaceae bacterium]|nr:stage III sporulation protein AC [Oscillospiraceae bacterium]